MTSQHHRIYRSLEIVWHKRYFVLPFLEWKYFSQKFLWTLFNFCMNFFIFACLDWYFKQKDTFPNPHEDLSLGISPAVITLMNEEVTSAMSGSGQTTGAKKCQINSHPMLGSILITKYCSHGHNFPFPTLMPFHQCVGFKHPLQK